MGVKSSTAQRFGTHGVRTVSSHKGGRQNYGPFLGPYYSTAPIFRVPKKVP